MSAPLRIDSFITNLFSKNKSSKTFFTCTSFVFVLFGKKKKIKKKTFFFFLFTQSQQSPEILIAPTDCWEDGEGIAIHLSKKDLVVSNLLYLQIIV